ncbi:hypothetical protein F4818DRAFT_415015 [Hypoxylon cercidicola]|nr:hypothetical protein F4818DRAFT_415015 [Hypoxylon cercidicola]
MFVSPPSSPPPASGSHGAIIHTGPTTATRSSGAMSQYPNVPIKRPYPRYFYISHVANHRSLDDAWVVEPDDSSGFNVFRITNLLKEIGTTESEYRAVIVTGPQGPTLARGDQRAELIRTRLNAIKPIGKLILLRRAEEVAECNGQNGQPAWVSLGPDIYDITNFPLQPSDEHLGLAQSAGGPVPRAVMESNTGVDQLLRRLDPYRCAYLDEPQPARIMQYFTPRQLRWYDNPDLGIYIAVNNVVFDITTYLRFHPGGNRLLLQYTGRDATHAFQEYHDLSILKFYESMQVGYVVPEIEMKDMTADHVAVHDWVYDISALANEDPGLYETLHPYCGVDTTTALNGGDAGAHALVTLSFEKKSLIVAGLAKTSLPNLPRGELKNYDNHRTPRGALVVVNGYVYNTTHLMRYPHLYERALGPNWAGREITIPALAQWLATNFNARCVARLVDGPAWEKPNVNVDAREAFLAQTGPPYYRT